MDEEAKRNCFSLSSYYPKRRERLLQVALEGFYQLEYSSTCRVGRLINW
jgi:hypothetical protein